MQRLIQFSFDLGIISDKLAVDEVLQTNVISERYGLALTTKDAEELVKTRSEALRSNGRVEIGNTIINKIISTFCSSSYLLQANYAQTLHDLIETFYYMKNETLDMLGDDELINQMKIYFEYTCRGSIELLQGRELEKLARDLRYGINNYEDLEGGNFEGEECNDEKYKSY